MNGRVCNEYIPQMPSLVLSPLLVSTGVMSDQIGYQNASRR